MYSIEQQVMMGWWRIIARDLITTIAPLTLTVDNICQPVTRCVLIRVSGANNAIHYYQANGAGSLISIPMVCPASSGAFVLFPPLASTTTLKFQSSSGQYFIETYAWRTSITGAGNELGNMWDVSEQVVLP